MTCGDVSERAASRLNGIYGTQGTYGSITLVSCVP